MRWTHHHYRSRVDGALPITSMIDVFFLLLVYFLVQARFVAAESRLESELQQQREGAGGSLAALQPQVISVVMGEGGEPAYRIGGREAGSKAALTEVLRSLPREGGAFVRADADVPWWATTAAHQACRDAGFERVSHVPGHASAEPGGGS